jgi:ribonucleoside-diphosphate reductase alpha chain
MEKIAEHGTLAGIDEIPDSVKEIFVTAHDITPEWHIKMQTAFQKYTDNAVSKTINFPREATIEDIKNAYLLAYSSNCKGLTVYRDGSKENQVLSTGKTKKDEATGETTTQAIVAAGVTIVPRDRPDVTSGYTYKVKTAYGKLYITINDDEQGHPFEVFSHLGKAGGFFAAKAEAICRLMSLALRSGIDPDEIISQLKGIRGPTPSWTEDGRMILSLPDAIAQILEKHVNREQGRLDLNFEPIKKSAPGRPALGEEEEFIKPDDKPLADLGEAPACVECGAMLEISEGCLKCPACGFIKCG